MNDVLFDKLAAVGYSGEFKIVTVGYSKDSNRRAVSDNRNLESPL
jgi:hypothetical protein